MKQPETICLKDYKPCTYRITTTELTFEIFDEHTLVINRMQIVRNAEGPLRLDGERLELLCVKSDDRKLSPDAYEVTDEALVIFDPGETATVQVVTKIYPEKNTALEGLYRSGGIYCTQNEPHGFRRITYFIDRPDNMSVFTTKVIAEKAKYPVLLSNGNLGEQGSFEDGRHYALWHDPYPKPSYLFALVAGDLGVVTDHYVTQQGREVNLAIYVDKGNEPRCAHAMRSLKAAMQWDEHHYGRSYDLNVYNIVAVDSFNMGAMENKGLNIFNSHYVLADEATATDQDFLGIESVIAHEYFHNWTGNRITCRDWFQLTLKEGLTVFRDQCFSADMHSETVQRIRDVKTLRERQFVEDAGPTAHPIKPDRYIEINNFYTATVYEKGAEVIRMLHTILGPDNWRKAMDLYFDTFDGQAVRTEDFLWTMQQHSPIDLEQFSLWYSQERTPELKLEHRYDLHAKTLRLRLEQIIPANVQGAAQKPYCYPLQLAFLDHEGRALPLQCQHADQPLIERGIVLVRHASEILEFSGLESEPVLSVNRDFSAPIIVRYAQENPLMLMRHDSDGFNRYEAAQVSAQKTLKAMMQGGEAPAAFFEAFGQILDDNTVDLQFKAQLLELPSISAMMQQQERIDVAPIITAYDQLTRSVAETFAERIAEGYCALHRPLHKGQDALSVGERALKNRLLNFMMAADDPAASEWASAQYFQSVTMTDRIVALGALVNYVPDTAETALQHFYTRFRHDPLVMTKYFAVLASSMREGTLERVKALLDDPAFDLKVPNLVRALIGTFARNPYHFHAKDGSGYAFVAEKIAELDAVNPQIAAGLAGAYKSYSRMNEDNKEQMRSSLEGILAKEGLSKNVYEVVEKTLGLGA